MNPISDPLHLEDFSEGQHFAGTTRIRVDADQVIAFATEFDPQPFHLDDAAAADSVFGGLAASGWHTAAITMRLLCDSTFRPAGGIVGMGFDELRWPRPVRPGDELRVDVEVLAVRPSTSRPSQGIVTTSTTTLNQHDQPVQISVGRVLVTRRPPAAPITNQPERPLP